MSKKKKSIKYKQVERTPDNPLGRVGNFEWITVTPEGAGIGAPATSSEMIPEGAELSDAERRKTEAARGARYFNAAMERGSRPFVGAANLLGWTFAPGPMASATGASGLYNTFSGADGLADRANAVWSDPNSSAGDLAKATYPLILKPAVDAAMVAAPVVRVAAVGTMKPGVLEAEAKTAETGIQHGAQTTEGVSQALYPYEATRVIKEGPEIKVWRNYKGWNPATRYRLEGKPSFFERVDDLEPGYHSVHFKTGDSFHGIDGRQMTTPTEKKLLFDAYAADFPEGEILSTYGNISPGGVHGLNRFKTEYGWKQVGERTVHDTKGNEITIPVLQKPKINADRAPKGQPATSEIYQKMSSSSYSNNKTAETYGKMPYEVSESAKEFQSGIPTREELFTAFENAFNPKSQWAKNMRKAGFTEDEIKVIYNNKLQQLAHPSGIKFSTPENDFVFGLDPITNGYHDRATGSIRINASDGRTKQQMLETILHELKHREDFNNVIFLDPSISSIYPTLGKYAKKNYEINNTILKKSLDDLDMAKFLVKNPNYFKYLFEIDQNSGVIAPEISAYSSGVVNWNPKIQNPFTKFESRKLLNFVKNNAIATTPFVTAQLLNNQTKK